MLIKAGVDISRLRLEIRIKLTPISKIVDAIEGKELVITSTYEGNHLPGSAHYVNLAIDIRRYKKAQATRDAIGRELGPDYYVYLAKTHIHIGFVQR